MEPRQSSQEPQPQYVENQLIVGENDLEQVTGTLRENGLTVDVVDDVDGFRVLLLARAAAASEADRTTADAGTDDLVLAALRLLRPPPDATGTPIAEPNYVYGCPQMRGGQFVVPDPAPPRDVVLRPSPVGGGVRVLVV